MSQGKKGKKDIRIRLFKIFVIVIIIYVIFLVYSNLDLSQKREYEYFSNVSIRGNVIEYNDYIVKGAEPIFLDRGNKAVLLLHGLGGTPIELNELANYLADRNITVFVPLLPYQGRDYESIKQLDMNVVYSNITSYYNILKANYGEIYVGGLSSGGLLSLKVGENVEPQGIVSLASPITYGFNFLGDSTFYFFKVIGFISPNVRRIEWGLARNTSIAAELPSFDRMPVKTLLQDEYLTKEVKANLSEITSPILILQSRFDNRAAPSSAIYIYDNVDSKSKEVVYLNNSGHVISMDYDKEEVFSDFYNFVEKN